MNPENPQVKNVHRELQRATDEKSWNLRVDSALIIDAVHLFYDALMDLSLSSRLNLNAKTLMCGYSASWEHGYTIINYMKTVRRNGHNSELLEKTQLYNLRFKLFRALCLRRVVT